MVTLRRMKRNGGKGYIGCCCEAFYAKHRDEMEETGVPGIIIDIDNTTCYDLDRAKEAYAGRFEGQTNVNLELLSAVLNVEVGRVADGVTITKVRE